MHTLPPNFTETVQNTFGDPGHDWLKRLPDLIQSAARRWGISQIQPVRGLSYNYVAFAMRGDEEVVLKIGVPDRELASEISALRLFDGNGAVRLLEAEPHVYMFLLERLDPGEMLTSLQDDELETQTAAEVMLKLWKPAPPENSNIPLINWFDGFGRLHARFHGGSGPLEPRLVESAEKIAVEFFLERHVSMLLHGDLHHSNILSSARGWLAIDPKGVTGPAAYECGPFLINPWTKIDDQSRFRSIIKRRLDILSERLGFERERIRLWGLAHAVLSAWWNLEANQDWRYGMECAGVLSKL